MGMKKKILFIIWSYTYGGGAEALLTMIVNHLNPEKYDISIIEYEHAEYKVEPVKDHIHVLPPIEKIETPDHQKKGYQVYHTPEILIDKYIKGDYDLYVSFNYQIPTFLLPRGTKNISWIHGDVYDLAGESAARERRLQDQAFDKVRKIVAISDRTYQSLYDLFPRHRNKLEKLYSGCDMERIYNQSLLRTDIVLKKPALIYIGRLDENKDPVRALRVFSRVHQTNQELHLYYLGKGEQEALLSTMIEQAHLSEFVHLLGYKDNPFPIIRQADAAILLSHSEGFQMSFLEALCLGLPIISTDVGSARLLTNGEKCGRLVQTDEEAERAVLDLLQADKMEIRRECRKSVERFALQPYIARIEALFDHVMENSD